MNGKRGGVRRAVACVLIGCVLDGHERTTSNDRQPQRMPAMPLSWLVRDRVVASKPSSLSTPLTPPKHTHARIDRTHKRHSRESKNDSQPDSP